MTAVTRPSAAALDEQIKSLIGTAERRRLTPAEGRLLRSRVLALTAARDTALAALAPLEDRVQELAEQLAITPGVRSSGVGQRPERRHRAPGGPLTTKAGATPDAARAIAARLEANAR